MTDWDGEAQELLTQGVTAWQQGRRADAISAYQTLIDRYPDRPEGYSKLGVVYAESGNLEEAERHFRLALACDPHHAPALTNLGNALLERGQPDDAIALYTRALLVDPEYPPAHRNLAIAYRRQGYIGAAVTHLRQSQSPAAGSKRAGAGRPGVGRKPSLWVWLLVVLAAAAAVHWGFR
ncbi:MAG: tetratricopeptide repeat protein [Thermaerobacter sp.]|nr:tetratricopeptide repeat protein [Thermaerobacter sp.]